MREVLGQDSEAREGRLDVTGGRIWYRRVGSGEGCPLLVLHGGPGFPHDYLEPLEALSAERQVIFYDQLGCGLSDGPADTRLWTVARFIEELAEVRRALGLERAHLLGHSWGSMLATDYALTRPAGLVSLVLASPALSIPRWMEDAALYRKQLPVEVQEALDRHESAGTVDSPEYEAATLVFYRRHLCRLDPWPDSLARTQAGVGLEVYATMWGPSEFNATGLLASYERTDRLEEIDVPTLFTCGRYDEATPEASAWYHSLVRGSKLRVFEHSAHMPHLEETETYLEALRDFLYEVERGRAG